MASNGRLKDGRFASGNTFAKGHGAHKDGLNITNQCIGD